MKKRDRSKRQHESRLVDVSGRAGHLLRYILRTSTEKKGDRAKDREKVDREKTWVRKRAERANA